jgi:hypothetical protein
MPVIEKFDKQPRELRDYDIYFDKLLDRIEDTARTVDPVEALPVDGITLVAAHWVPELRCVKLWFSDGEDRQNYAFSFLFHTEGGRTFECDIVIKVKD